MHINTKMRIAALLYLMAAYAVALPFAGLGAILGFIYWLFFFRKYRHYDPLDKYFK
ncbi:MAG: hypothetical protein E7I11_06485 [Klebsiella michiganensis]|nr:hypothetical protein [Klebsiella michiganensis]